MWMHKKTVTTRRVVSETLVSSGPTSNLAGNEPFESHFSSPDESELSQKIKAASENKWKNAKKELPGGLKIWRAIPDCGQDDVPLLAAMKSMSSVKVSISTIVCSS
jgi:hypothetical protein